MSDKLLPIDRVAELDNVGILTIEYERYHYFVMFELTMPKDIPTLHCLAVQSVAIEGNGYGFNNNNPIVETSILATIYDGGYGAAIHDFVLWWMYTNYGPSAVSIADRFAVSDEAARVREIYANARKGSIDAFPIDNYAKKLTSQIDDDYRTHFDHGGFDVYPEYQGRRMANDKEAYKDWAVRLTEKGYKEISPACEHLLKMGEKILSFMESQVDKTKQNEKQMIREIVNYANHMFDDLYDDTPHKLALYEKTFQKAIGRPHQAPILDKTKKTTQKLGSYTYNPRRRTRRRL